MATTAINLAQYLDGPIPHPDSEFIDGDLREKGLVQSNHALLQGLIVSWFNANRRAWSIRAAVESRIQVAAQRVRIADVVIAPAGKWKEVL